MKKQFSIIFLTIIAILIAATSNAQTPRNGKIAFVSDRDGNREIYVMDPDGDRQTRLTFNSANDDFPEWSPDGRRIAFLRHTPLGNQHLKIVNSDGSGEVTVTTTSSSSSCDDGWGRTCGITWSPDGSKIAFSDLGDIFTINTDGTGRVNLTNSTSTELDPSWSPDGTKIAFTLVTCFAPGPCGVSSIISTVRVQEAMVQAFPGTGTMGNLGDMHGEWSGDQHMIAAILSRYPVDWSDLVLMRDDGTRYFVDWGVERDHASPAWSPDGIQLVFEGAYGSNSEIHTIYPYEDRLHRLTDSQFFEGRPSWQPLDVEVSISGRLTGANGRGINGAVVSFTDSLGVRRTARTNSFGYYGIPEIPGDTYNIFIRSKRYEFQPQTVFADENLIGVDFVSSN